MRTVLDHKQLRMDVCVSPQRIKIITEPAFHFLLPKAFHRAVYIYHTGDLLLLGRFGGGLRTSRTEVQSEEMKEAPNRGDIAALSAPQTSRGNISDLSGSSWHLAPVTHVRNTFQ